MDVFDLHVEQEFSNDERVEKILGRYSGGDVTVAGWEPGQKSLDHAHPEAIEIYFCFEGGGMGNTTSTQMELRERCCFVFDMAVMSGWCRERRKFSRGPNGRLVCENLFKRSQVEPFDGK